MNTHDKVYKIFELIQEERLKQKQSLAANSADAALLVITKMNTAKFVVLESFEDQTSQRRDSAMEDMFGGYNAFGQDTRVVDPESKVLNLKSPRIEIKERIFVDKPISKQLEITLEEKKQISKAKQLADPNGKKSSFEQEIVFEEKKGSGYVRQEDDFLYG
jgi:hypothetical protein